MEENLDLDCPSCHKVTRKPVDWLHHHTECRCEHCGDLITIAMNKEWSEFEARVERAPPRRQPAPAAVALASDVLPSGPLKLL